MCLRPAISGDPIACAHASLWRTLDGSVAGFTPPGMKGRLRLFKTYFVMGRGANNRTMWRNRSFLYGLAMQTTAPSECALE